MALADTVRILNDDDALELSKDFASPSSHPGTGEQQDDGCECIKGFAFNNQHRLSAGPHLLGFEGTQVQLRQGDQDCEDMVVLLKKV